MSFFLQALMAMTNWLDFSNSRFSFSRSVWSYARVQKFVATVLRERRIQLRSFGNVQYVNLGCGSSLASGFCNVDYDWRPGVLCWDITKGVPFASSSVQGIFSEHCLEHIPHDQCLSVLRELRRILRPSGVARLIVPDGELYCRLYLDSIAGSQAIWPYPSAIRLRWGM